MYCKLTRASFPDLAVFLTFLLLLLFPCKAHSLFVFYRVLQPFPHVLRGFRRNRTSELWELGLLIFNANSLFSTYLLFGASHTLHLLSIILRSLFRKSWAIFVQIVHRNSEKSRFFYFEYLNFSQNFFFHERHTLIIASISFCGVLWTSCGTLIEIGHRSSQNSAFPFWLKFYFRSYLVFLHSHTLDQSLWFFPRLSNRLWAVFVQIVHRNSEKTPFSRVHEERTVLPVARVE